MMVENCSITSVLSLSQDSMICTSFNFFLSKNAYFDVGKMYFIYFSNNRLSGIFLRIMKKLNCICLSVENILGLSAPPPLGMTTIQMGFFTSSPNSLFSLREIF